MLWLDDGLINIYLSGLIHCHRYKHKVALLPVKQSWEILLSFTERGLVTPYGSLIGVNIDSSNGLLPDGTKPLSEPMLNNQKWVLWLSLKSKLTGSAEDIYHWCEFENWKLLVWYYSCISHGPNDVLWLITELKLPVTNIIITNEVEYK